MADYLRKTASRAGEFEDAFHKHFLKMLTWSRGKGFLTTDGSGNVIDATITYDETRAGRELAEWREHALYVKRPTVSLSDGRLKPKSATNNVVTLSMKSRTTSVPAPTECITERIGIKSLT